jgi:hypothetical protein
MNPLCCHSGFFLCTNALHANKATALLIQFDLLLTYTFLFDSYLSTLDLCLHGLDACLLWRWQAAKNTSSSHQSPTIILQSWVSALPTHRSKRSLSKAFVDLGVV